MVALAGLVGCAGGCPFDFLGPGPTVGNNGPLAPRSPYFPPAGEVGGFERDDAGLPILLRVPSQLAPGYDLVVAYDEKRDDPIARWGQCMSRVVACVQANPGQLIDGCIPKIERCADDSGGPGCCPPACLDAYAARRSAGDDEEAALLATFFDGSCVTGLAQQLADAADAGEDDGGIR